MLRRGRVQRKILVCSRIFIKLEFDIRMKCCPYSHNNRYSSDCRSSRLNISYITDMAHKKLQNFADFWFRNFYVTNENHSTIRKFLAKPIIEFFLCRNRNWNYEWVGNGNNKCLRCEQEARKKAEKTSCFSYFSYFILTSYPVFHLAENARAC